MNHLKPLPPHGIPLKSLDADVVVGGLDAAEEADAGWEEHGWDEGPGATACQVAPAATGLREGPPLPARGSAGPGLEAREEQGFLHRQAGSNRPGPVPVYRSGSSGNR
jgi:hypothetical protein